MAKSEVITFGCRLNQYESEIIQRHADAAGLKNTSIVNTCSVTAEAVRQARQLIRRLKKKNPKNTILVTGCAAQINPEIFAAMPEVNCIIGNEEKLKPESYDSIREQNPIRVSDIMKAGPIYSNEFLTRFETRTRAYIQVQQGCNHRCTFCIIPFGRGNSRSIPLDSLIEQVRILTNNGYKELVLTGVDISSYGSDLAGKPGLGNLVRNLLRQAPNLERLRLSSLDPAEIDNTLISLIAADHRLMPHLHLSVQAGNNVILKRMKRRHTRQDVIDLCNNLRDARPGIVFGADVIVGFPTEDENMFEETLKLVDEAGLTYLHVFPYSPREGTPAARMPQVPHCIRKERSQKLRQKAFDAKSQYFDKLIGSYANVLSENKGRGYTEHYAPVQFKQNMRSGYIHEVKITGRNDHVLAVEPTN